MRQWYHVIVSKACSIWYSHPCPVSSDQNIGHYGKCQTHLPSISDESMLEMAVLPVPLFTNADEGSTSMRGFHRRPNSSSSLMCYIFFPSFFFPLRTIHCYRIFQIFCLCFDNACILPVRYSGLVVTNSCNGTAIRWWDLIPLEVTLYVINWLFLPERPSVERQWRRRRQWYTWSGTLVV